MLLSERENTPPVRICRKFYNSFVVAGHRVELLDTVNTYTEEDAEAPVSLDAELQAPAAVPYSGCERAATAERLANATRVVVFGTFLWNGKTSGAQPGALLAWMHPLGKRGASAASPCSAAASRGQARTRGRRP